MNIIRPCFKEILLLVFIVILTSLHAQVPSLDWAYSFGGAGTDVIRASAQDPQGNLIQVGYFEDTVDFDRGSGVAQKAVLTNDRDMFVQKVDASGNFLWVKVFSGSGVCIGHRVVIDELENIYVSGIFEGATQDFNPDPSLSFILNRGIYIRAMFLLKLNSQGDFIWAKAQSGASAQHEGLALDTLGNIYTVGNFSSALDSDPEPTSQTTIYPSSGSKKCVFIQKVDTSGVQKYFATIKGNDDIETSAIAVGASQNPVFVGNFKGNADFDPGSGTNYLTATSGKTNGYVMELDTSANYVSSSLIQGGGNSKCIDLQIDGAQNIYITGQYEGNVDFNPGTAVLFPRLPTSTGWFVEKISPNGNLLWARPYENSLQSLDGYYIQLQVDPFENVYVSGAFRNTPLSLEPFKSGGVSLNYSSVSGSELFIAKHASNGDLLWAHGFAGVHTHVYKALLSASGQLIVSGFYSGAFNPDPYFSLQESSNGLMDCFILKFNGCHPSDSTQVISACGFYEVSPGHRIFKDSLFVDTLISIGGCDSIFKRDIQFDHIASVQVGNGSLSWDSTVAVTSVTFSWYDCNSKSLVPGEISPTFVPKKNGSYALIVNDGFCIDTSNCFTINNVSTKELLGTTNLEVYPNPTNGILNIEYVPKEVQIILYNLSGKVLLQQVFKEENRVIDLSGLSKGVYLLELQGKTGERDFRKVIKE